MKIAVTGINLQSVNGRKTKRYRLLSRSRLNSGRLNSCQGQFKVKYFLYGLKRLSVFFPLVRCRFVPVFLDPFQPLQRCKNKQCKIFFNVWGFTITQALALMAYLEKVHLALVKQESTEFVALHHVQ